VPREAEGTGRYFSPDARTLFVSVQHPALPKPSTVAITRVHGAAPGLNVIPRPA
jgi:secreted PhoX family phosphatase